MAFEQFVEKSGSVTSRPSIQDQVEARLRGHYIITGGRLCTVCLTGTWPMTQFRMSQYYCSTCAALDVRTSTLAAVQPVLNNSEAQRVGSQAYRSARLAVVFDLALERGFTLVEPVERWGSHALAMADLQQFLPATEADRVHRFAEWVLANAPERYAERADVLGDDGARASEIRESLRAAREARARTQVRDAVGAMRRGLADLRAGLAALLLARTVEHWRRA